MTRKAFAIILPIFALLAACGETGADADVEMIAAEEPVAVAENDGLPAPDKAILTEAVAEACPGIEPVNVASCRAQGMGAEDFTCEYGLGDDDVLRHEATLTPDGERWAVADVETTCAQHAE